MHDDVRTMEPEADEVGRRCGLSAPPAWMLLVDEGQSSLDEVGRRRWSRNLMMRVDDQEQQQPEVDDVRR